MRFPVFVYFSRLSGSPENPCMQLFMKTDMLDLHLPGYELFFNINSAMIAVRLIINDSGQFRCLPNSRKPSKKLESKVIWKIVGEGQYLRQRLGSNFPKSFCPF
jgi:hypothetical protein